MSVIRNTNTKIILRLPEKSDRELVGYSASLNDEQLEELSKLKCGVAAIYQNDWVEPVLVQVNKCDISESIFDFKEKEKVIDLRNIRSQIINLLIQGRVNERLEFDIKEIEGSLETLGLSSFNIEFIEEQIEEYKSEGTLEIWKDENFKRLSRRITDILGVRSRVENYVVSVKDNDELSDMLKKIISQNLSEISEERIIALSQCLMKDMSSQEEEKEIREKLYMQWVEFVRKRGMKI